MKTLCNLCKKLQFCEPKKKPIDMGTICQIIGNLSQGEFRGIKHSNYPVVAGWTQREDQSAYVLRIKKEFNKKGIEVETEELRFEYIPESSKQYHTNYKIIIKDLAINVEHDGEFQSMFCDILDSGRGEVGIYLVFENNDFITKNKLGAAVRFCPARLAYLIFKNNKFEFMDVCLQSYNSYKVELTGNEFINSNVEIISHPNSANPLDVQPNIVCLENNTFHRNDGISSELKFNGEKDTKCYFKGKNTVDNLIISTDGYLNWGGYQNIDPQDKHAYTHKQMFIELIEKAVQNNNNTQEARLRRELLKCERVLIQKEKTPRSLQDRFILGWSSLISDYGISWFRPFLWLAFINALLTAIILIVKFFNPECLPDFSYDKWWFLFAKLFSPLSNLSDLTGVENSGWITFINVAQKAFLAAIYYEMIKIFRRFSK